MNDQDRKKAVSRRNFLKSTVAAGIALPAAALLPYRNDLERIEITYNRIKSQRITPAFKGYKIVLISDIHCGVYLSETMLEHTISEIIKLAPDLVVLGGDYVGIPDAPPSRLAAGIYRNVREIRGNHREVSEIFERLGASLARLSPPDGVYAVLGNHDNWHNSEICREVLGRVNVKFLINREHIIHRGSEKIRIFGTDDYWTGVPRINEDFIGSNREDFKILVSHNPDYIGEIVSQRGVFFDLGLSGHTHGGQICLFNRMPIAGYGIQHSELGCGAFKLSGSTVYTTRGIGVVDVPIRLNCPPEIAVFELV